MFALLFGFVVFFIGNTTFLDVICVSFTKLVMLLLFTGEFSQHDELVQSSR